MANEMSSDRTLGDARRVLSRVATASQLLKSAAQKSGGDTCLLKSDRRKTCAALLSALDYAMQQSSGLLSDQLQLSSLLTAVTDSSCELDVDQKLHAGALAGGIASVLIDETGIEALRVNSEQRVVDTSSNVIDGQPLGIEPGAPAWHYACISRMPVPLRVCHT